MDFEIILYCLVLCTTSAAIVIEVDNTNGHDSSSCLIKNGGACKTFDYALINGLSSFTTVMIHEGVYSINLHNLSFYDLADVAIYGAGSNLTIIKCSFGTGLGFFNVKQLVLANFILLGGGRIMNSTSINITTGDLALFRVALYLMNCSDVTIEGLEVTNSTGTGLAMYDVTGKVDMINSVFQYNKPLENEKLPGGGGVSVLFTKCKIGETSPCSETVTRGTFYNIQNCTFLSNNVTSSDNIQLFQSPIFSSARQQFGCGAGLKVLMRGVAQNNTMIIKDSKFLHNQAVWGGGLFIELLDDSKDNHFVLENLLFTTNYLTRYGFLSSTGTGGGAVRIAILPNFFSNYNTTFNFINCLFQNNTADLGRGISFELIREKPDTSTFIYFTNCTWYHNIGRLGSAIDAFVHTYPLGEVAKFNFDSCNFIENSNHYSQLSVKPLGLGTMYLWSVPVYFNNKNVFTGNNGSALVGMSTWCVFKRGSVVVFEKNTADNGGAITLIDNSYFVLFENTTLNFTYNTAAGKGGVIYAVIDGQRSFTSSRFCFIIFHNSTVSPYKWREQNITIYFSNNSAKYGNSIFTTTLLTCVWGELTNIQLAEIKQVYYWNGTFIYEGIANISDLSKEISSEATNIDNLKNTSYTFPPGKLYYFRFVAENDRNEAVDTVYFVTTNDSSVAVVDDTLSYTSESNTMLYGAPGNVIDLNVVTTNSLPLSVSISVKLDDCPPGFYPSTESRSNKTACKCSVNVADQEYFGIIKCDSSNMVAYLTPSYFAGYKVFGNKDVLLTSSCPEGYCTGSSVQLPPNSSSQALDDVICKSQSRTGMLCGKCSEGNYIFINSPNYPFECGKCNMSLWLEILLLLTTKYIPLTIFVYILGFFSISLVNGPLNSFVLFSQLLPFMGIYAGGRIKILNQPVVKTYRFLYGMWNLNFFEILLPGFCILHTQSALDMILFDNLITFLYLILLTIVMYSKKYLAYSKHCVNKRNCTYVSKITGKIYCFFVGKNQGTFRIQGLLTMIILCYTKLTALGFDLLSNTTLYGPSKDDSDKYHKVFWLDGTKEYVQTRYWYYITIASIGLIFVGLIPFLLCIYPLLRKSQLFHQSLRMGDTRVNDAFQDRYKDNLVACRFSAFYFLYRLGVLAIIAYAPSNSEQFVGMSYFFLLTLAFHCWFQPYKNNFYNIVDMSMFINLTLISIISFYRLHAVTLDLSETVKSFVCQTILIYLPLVYIILLVLWRRYLCWCKINKRDLPNVLKKLKEFTEGAEEEHATEMINSTEYQRIQ